MEQETIEEALNSEIKLVHDVVRNKDFDLGFQTGGIFGAKWQAERMGLMEIELRHTKTLLASCEKALEDRDKQADRMYSEANKIMKFLDTEKELKLSDAKTIERIKWYFETYFEQFKKK
jgi:hypothetical protein